VSSAELSNPPRWRVVAPPIIATVVIAGLCAISRWGNAKYGDDAFHTGARWASEHSYVFFVPVPLVLVGWLFAFRRRPVGDHMITHLATIVLAFAILIVPPVLISHTEYIAP
jgi:hypothetical protein